MSSPSGPAGGTTDGPDTSVNESGARASRILSGRYEIHRTIARGGMAEVFLARDRLLDRPVAVKMLFPEYANDSSFVERFRREAQSAGRLTHPNIVGVYDWGAEDGTYYIVMEYVDGRSLAEILRSSGPLHPRRAAEIATEIAAALGFAHERGVVHRDVKPGNVLISSNGTPKVTDFGIARALSTNDDNLTQVGSVMGTASYFSPEQAQGFHVDARSDLYSLGVVMYEMVCGRPPFQGDTPVSIAYQHVQASPPRPSSIVPSIPHGFEAIVGRLLAKKPERRYPTADALISDLRAFLDGAAPTAVNRRAADPTQALPSAAGVVAAAASSPAPTTVGRAVAPARTVAEASATGGPQPPVETDDEDYDGIPSRSWGFLTLLVVLLAAVGALLFWFVRSLDQGGAREVVPQVVGLTEDEATRRLEAREFVVVVKPTASDDVEAGKVIAQSPREGDSVERGSEVTIDVSTGSDQVEVPKVDGMTQAEATQIIEAAGLEVAVNNIESESPVGTVVTQDPLAGVKIDRGAKVTLSVSAGQETVNVPQLQGITQEQAEERISARGLVLGKVTTRASDAFAAGLVVEFSPQGSVPTNTAIDLVISTGSANAEVPETTGKTEDSATAALDERGLEWRIVFEPLDAGDPNIGRVISSDPAAGESVPKGSTVELTVGAEDTSASSSSSSSTPSSSSSSSSTTSTP